MKKGKIFVSALLAAITLFSVTITVGCGDKDVLRIYNCDDYIDEALLKDFETYYQGKTGKTIKVEYSTFPTPEDAYNDIKIQKEGYYDLVCPSDYMIEKMAKENMLEEIEMPEDGNYATYVSPFIKKVFSDIKWEGGKSLSNYAAGYMWGTLGLVYNTEKVDGEDMTSWSSLWDSKYSGKFTIKDSVRDTYFVCLAKYHADELNAAKAEYNGDAEKLSAYQATLKSLFNDTKADTVSAVKGVLNSLNNNCFASEVDDGKETIIKDDIDIYLAWSGDAVYAMTEAEEAGVSLEYSVPDEGSNIWFDGWCVPKGSQKIAEAIEFIDFLSKPENVVRNMDYLGYVSVIGGDEVFDYVKETYEETDGEHAIDLSYFFGSGDYTVKTSNLKGTFCAQYPSLDVINRCVVMNYFADADNERINTMWMEVKA